MEEIEKGPPHSDGPGFRFVIYDLRFKASKIGNRTSQTAIFSPSSQTPPLPAHLAVTDKFLIFASSKTCNGYLVLTKSDSTPEACITWKYGTASAY
jgi:hypothetical protein